MKNQKSAWAWNLSPLFCVLLGYACLLLPWAQGAVIALSVMIVLLAWTVLRDVWKGQMKGWQTLLAGADLIILFVFFFASLHRSSPAHFSSYDSPGMRDWVLFVLENLTRASDIPDCLDVGRWSFVHLDPRSLVARSTLVAFHLLVDAVLLLALRDFMGRIGFFRLTRFLAKSFRSIRLFLDPSLLDPSLANIKPRKDGKEEYKTFRLYLSSEDQRLSMHPFWKRFWVGLILGIFFSSFLVIAGLLEFDSRDIPEITFHTIVIFALEQILRVLDVGDILRIFEIQISGFEARGTGGIVGLALFRVFLAWTVVQFLVRILQLTVLRRIQTLPGLLASLEDYPLKWRQSVRDEIVRRGEREALEEVVRDSSFPVEQMHATLALAKFSGGVPLVLAQRNLFRGEGPVRWVSALVVGEMEGAKGVDSLTEFLSDPEWGEGWSRYWEGKKRKEGEMIDPCSEIWEAVHPPVESTDDGRAVLVVALRSAGGPSALEALLAVAFDPNEDLRRVAVFSLQDFEDPRVVSAFLGALDDESVKVRIEAIRGLGTRGSPEVVETLGRRIGFTLDGEEIDLDDEESSLDSGPRSLPEVTHEEEVAVTRALVQIDSPQAIRIVESYQHRRRWERSWVYRVKVFVGKIWRWVTGRSG